MVQFPTAFEFSDRLLVFLADHVFSCLFGNFLGNWEKQRLDLSVQEKTTSVWAYVMKSSALFKNDAYQPLPRPIEPTASLKKVRLWERYYCRWDSAMHPHELAGTAWIDDWGSLDADASFEKRKTALASEGSFRTIVEQRMAEMTIGAAALAELDAVSPNDHHGSARGFEAALAGAHEIGDAPGGAEEGAETGDAEDDMALAVTDERASFMDEYRGSSASAGSFTEEQVTEFRGAFEVFDKDNDGQIGPQEMAEILDSIGHTHTREELQMMMERAGTTAGEKMDFEAFVRMMAMWVQELDPQ